MNNNLVGATGIMGGVGVAAAASTSAGSPTAAAANSASGREARNLAEKHRRDKLNASIHELSTMVPHVAESTRRLDKTAVLRFAAHGLRLCYVFGKSGKPRIARSTDNDDPPTTDVATVPPSNGARPQFTDTLMQLLDSFFITLTCHGQIVLISSSIEQLLGHCQSDLYGQNLLHITHPEDHALLRQQLIPNDLETLFRLVHENGDSSFEADEQFHMGEEEEVDDDMADLETDDNVYYRSPSPRTMAQHAVIDQRLREDKRSFTVRLARAGIRSEAQRTYEIIKIDGCFRRSDCTPSSGNYPIVSQLIRRARGQHVQHDAIAQAALHGISGNDIVLVAMCRIIRPPKPSSWILDSNNLEYKTRHLIDGRIVDCDQRISLVAGYMKDEVRNLSPFSFMHQDDVRWVIVALRQMYDCNSDYGESCFRLLSRNGHFIYLQSKGYLEIDKNTNKVHSFVCVNTLLDEEEGKRKVQEMKNKFSVIINTKIPSSSLVDVPASQNPQQLEKIVLCLIENLQKRHELEGNCSSASNEDSGRFTKTPPLALVPPEASSVKTSITESVNIVNVTAAKNLFNHNNNNNNYSTITNNSQKSPSLISEMSFSPASSTDHENTIEEYNTEPTLTQPVVKMMQQRQQRPSVLQLSSQNYQSSSAATIASIQTSPASTSSIIVYNNKTPLLSNASSVMKSPTAGGISATTVVVPATITIIPNTNGNSNRTQQHSPATQMLQQQISVLKRLHATSDANTSAPNNNGESLSPVKRRSTGNEMILLQSPTTTSREIHNVLTTSLQKLDHTLHTIGSDTIALRDQHAQFIPHVPHAINQKLGEIIVEQQKQKEILVNIKSEYNVQMQHHAHPPHPQQDVISIMAASTSSFATTNATATTAAVAALIQQKHNKNNLKISRRTTTQRKPI